MLIAAVLATALMVLPPVSASVFECFDSKGPDFALLARADASALVFRIRIVSALPAHGSHVVLVRVAVVQRVKGQNLIYARAGCEDECQCGFVLALEVAPEERPSFLRALPDTEQIVFMSTLPRYLLNYARIEPSAFLPVSPSVNAGIASILSLLDRPVDPHCQ